MAFLLRIYLVTPAKAGVQLLVPSCALQERLDSRFRGNDGCGSGLP
jgi:hypothetical protein